MHREAYDRIREQKVKRFTKIKRDELGDGFHFFVPNASTEDGADLDRIIRQAGLSGRVTWSSGQNGFRENGPPSLVLTVKGSRLDLDVVQTVWRQEGASPAPW